MLRRLAGNGGVVMITFVPDFVNRACAEHAAAEDARRHELGLDKVTVYTEADHAGARPGGGGRAGRLAGRESRAAGHLADVADHVEHAREIAGREHIGLGGDFDGVDELPVGLEDVSRYPALLAELADRGWSDADLAALTCGNILRVLEKRRGGRRSGLRPVTRRGGAGRSCSIRRLAGRLVEGELARRARRARRASADAFRRRRSAASPRAARRPISADR